MYNKNRMNRKNPKKHELDNLVINIEFSLISIVQGFALSALAAAAVSLIATNQFEYWPYLVSAFFIILIFWSQAIVHTLSFIDWPIDLVHSFLYFLAGLVEVTAFGQMTNPLRWFIAILALYLVGTALYFVDLKLIQKHKKTFSENRDQRALYQHILKQQHFDLKVAVPAGVAFHSIALILIWLYPQFFIAQHGHLYLAFLQAVVAVLSLIEALHSFKNRTQLITNTI